MPQALFGIGVVSKDFFSVFTPAADRIVHGRLIGLGGNERFPGAQVVSNERIPLGSNTLEFHICSVVGLAATGLGNAAIGCVIQCDTLNMKVT